MTSSRRVIILGGSGTAGRTTVRALLRRNHKVVCFLRPGSANERMGWDADVANSLEGATLRYGEATDPTSLSRDGFCGEQFDVLVSCLASRTGVPRDAWSIDYQAHISALNEAKKARVSHMILLSAICVQKPLLAFQHAKLAFEKALIGSGLTYSIVRPTAFFKSLSGQIDRVKKGKSFLLFGDGMLTACKPISDYDLGEFVAGCIADESRHNCILPIGGPGEAITPKQQGEHLFRLMGHEPKFRYVPVSAMDAIAWMLTAVGRVFPSIAEKAELARIGRYYATESMLVGSRKPKAMMPPPPLHSAPKRCLIFTPA